jgi:hypothetical protein
VASPTSTYSINGTTGAAVLSSVIAGKGSSTDQSVTSNNAVTQCIQNASATSVTSANQYCGFFSVNIPKGHGSNIPYEVAPIYARCVTADSNDNGIADYDCVGGEFQGQTAGTGQRNRIWGADATINVVPGSDAYATGYETDIINYGTTGDLQTPTAKLGFNAVCRTGNNCTSGFNIGSDQHALWEYGFRANKQDLISGGCAFCVLDASQPGLPALGAYYADGHSLTFGNAGITGPGGTNRVTNYYTGPNASSLSLRWASGASDTGESGSNVGSDYRICSYTDAGAFSTCPLLIQRSSGTTFVQNLSSSGSVAANKVNLTPDVTPTSPNNGDVWSTANGVYSQTAGLIVGPFATRNDINVLDYMTSAQKADVTGCGQTLDVATAINTAVAAAGAAKGRVVLPNGCYRLGSTITLGTNLELVGASERGVKLYPTGNFPAILAAGTYAAGLGGVGVRNMTIVCAGMTNTNAMGVSFTYVNRGILKDLYFNGCYHALDLYDQWQTVADNITVDGLGAQQNYIGTYLGAPTDAANLAPNNAVIMSNSVMQNVAKYGYHLAFFAGSKFINDEAMNGVSGWKLCDASYIIANQACQFGHFVNILADTTSGAGIDIQQGANAQAINNLMFDHVWIGNSVNYGLYLSGLVYSQFDNFHITATDVGVALRNSNHVKLSANIAQYNRNNTASNAVLIDGTTASMVTAINSQSAYPNGYNGIVELSNSSANSIWGGLAPCNVGLAFGGSSTGLTTSKVGCEYEVTGQQLRLQYNLMLSAKGSATGVATLTNLPFIVQNSSTSQASFGGVSQGLAVSGFTSLTGPVLSQANQNTTTASLLSQGSSGMSNLTDAVFTDASILTGTLTYTKQ